MDPLAAVLVLRYRAGVVVLKVAGLDLRRVLAIFFVRQSLTEQRQVMTRADLAGAVGVTPAHHAAC